MDGIGAIGSKNLTEINEKGNNLPTTPADKGGALDELGKGNNVKSAGDVGGVCGEGKGTEGACDKAAAGIEKNKECEA